MMQVLERGRWSITYGGEADPVWTLRLRVRKIFTPVGRPYDSLMDLVRAEVPTADPILFNLLEIAEARAESEQMLAAA